MVYTSSHARDVATERGVLFHKERRESKGFASFVVHAVRLPKHEAVFGLTFDNGGDA